MTRRRMRMHAMNLFAKYHSSSSCTAAAFETRFARGLFFAGAARLSSSSEYCPSISCARKASSARFLEAGVDLGGPLRRGVGFGFGFDCGTTAAFLSCLAEGCATSAASLRGGGSATSGTIAFAFVFDFAGARRFFFGAGAGASYSSSRSRFLSSSGEMTSPLLRF